MKNQPWWYLVRTQSYWLLPSNHFEWCSLGSYDATVKAWDLRSVVMWWLFPTIVMHSSLFPLRCRDTVSLHTTGRVLLIRQSKWWTKLRTVCQVCNSLIMKYSQGMYIMDNISHTIYVVILKLNHYWLCCLLWRSVDGCVRRYDIRMGSLLVDNVKCKLWYKQIMYLPYGTEFW